MNSHEQAIALIKNTCNYYKIKPEQLQMGKKLHSHKVCKNKDGHHIRLSEIRMALSYFLYKYCPLRLVEIAPLVGYADHSTMSTYRKTIEYYIETEDPYFYPYYLQIIDLASDLGITMRNERVSSRHNSMIFKDYKGNLSVI